MKHLHLIKFFAFTLILLISATSCSKDELNADTELSAISVNLKSTTLTSNAVFLDIADVQVKVKADGSLPNAWVSLNVVNTGAQNVSNLNEDSTLTLVDHFEIQPTNIYEIRLVLADNNFVNINETLFSLDIYENGNATPSNLMSSELEANRFYDITINLSIDESIWFNDIEKMMVLSPKLYTEIRQIKY